MGSSLCHGVKSCHEILACETWGQVLQKDTRVRFLVARLDPIGPDEATEQLEQMEVLSQQLFARLDELTAEAVGDEVRGSA